MAAFSDILLTVDFDRTLTAPDSTIPQRNLDAIRFFMENGGAFTVNTGRSVPTFRSLMDIIPANAPYLLYNGSGAYDPVEGQLTLQRPIDLPMLKTLEAVHAKFPEMNLEIQGIDAHYCYHDAGNWELFCDALNCDRAFMKPGGTYGPFLKFCLFGQVREPCVNHLFHGSQEELARMDEAEAWLNETFGDKVAVFRAAPRIIDVHAKGVSKIRAARELQEKLGRKILVCVGDAENDIPMLLGADYAYSPCDGVVADRFPNVCECGKGAVADVIYKKIPEILGFTLDNQPSVC